METMQCTHNGNKTLRGGIVNIYTYISIQHMHVDIKHLHENGNWKMPLSQRVSECHTEVSSIKGYRQIHSFLTQNQRLWEICVESASYGCRLSFIDWETFFSLGCGAHIPWHICWEYYFPSINNLHWRCGVLLRNTTQKVAVIKNIVQLLAMN